MLKRILLAAALPAALTVSGCGLPRTASYFHPSAADIGPALDNYGEAIVPAHGHIVVQGDDLVYGTAAKRGRPAINGAPAPRQALSLTEAMRRTLRGVTIENLGYPGDSIVDGFERWGAHPKGDLLIICYGLGDLNAKTPAATYEQTLRLMVRRAHAQGAAVFLITWPGLGDPKISHGMDAYREAMRKVGAEEGAEVFEGYQDLDRAHVVWPKSPNLTPQMVGLIAGDLVAYIKIVDAPARAAQPSPPQSGQAGSGPTATVRASADRAS